MDFVTVRELREKSREIWLRVEAGEEFVVTRNGKPFALLVHTEPQAVEERLRALRAVQLGEVVRRIRAQAKAPAARAITDEEIQAEIAAVRRQRRAKTALPPEPKAVAEPAPKPYARRGR